MSEDFRDIDDKSIGRFARAVRELREIGPTGLVRAIRANGVNGTLGFVARNIRYLVADKLARQWDRRYCVDTAGSIPLDLLSVVGQNGAQGNECVSTSPKTFDFMMRHLPEDLDGYTFVDIGSGKARTLMLASRYRFKSIVGVEFARELVDISHRNIAAFRADWQRCQDLRVIYADAAEYPFPQAPLAVFFYNPFAEDIFRQVLHNLEGSLKTTPRPCFVLYSSSNAGAIDWARPLLTASPLFKELPTRAMPRFLDAIRVVRYAVFKTV